MATTGPILCVDFDGVIHSYISHWRGIDVIPDPPVEGAFEWLDAALEHFIVVIFSSRCSKPEGIMAMRDWFRSHEYKNVDELSFAATKPAAFLTIDDRAICFTGEWPSMHTLLMFKPWHATGG